MAKKSWCHGIHISCIIYPLFTHVKGEYRWFSSFWGPNWRNNAPVRAQRVHFRKKKSWQSSWFFKSMILSGPIGACLLLSTKAHTIRPRGPLKRKRRHAWPKVCTPENPVSQLKMQNFWWKNPVASTQFKVDRAKLLMWHSIQLPVGYPDTQFQAC